MGEAVPGQPRPGRPGPTCAGAAPPPRLWCAPGPGPAPSLPGSPPRRGQGRPGADPAPPCACAGRAADRQPAGRWRRNPHPRGRPGVPPGHRQCVPVGSWVYLCAGWAGAGVGTGAGCSYRCSRGPASVGVRGPRGVSGKRVCVVVHPLEPALMWAQEASSEQEPALWWCFRRRLPGQNPCWAWAGAACGVEGLA